MARRSQTQSAPASMPQGQPQDTDEKEVLATLVLKMPEDQHIDLKCAATRARVSLGEFALELLNAGIAAKAAAKR